MNGSFRTTRKANKCNFASLYHTVLIEKVKGEHKEYSLFDKHYTDYDYGEKG